MSSTPDDAGTTPDATTLARELIASFGHDPDRYVPGSVATLPGTRTTVWAMSCSPDCPHTDGRCHRPHAAWSTEDPLVRLRTSAPQAGTTQAANRAAPGPRVPVQRRRA